MGKGSSAPPPAAAPQVITPNPTDSMTQEQKALSSMMGGFLQTQLGNSQEYLQRPLNQLLPQNPNPQRANFPQFDPQQFSEFSQQWRNPGAGMQTRLQKTPSPGAGGGKPPPTAGGGASPSPGAGGGKSRYMS